MKRSGINWSIMALFYSIAWRATEFVQKSLNRSLLLRRSCPKKPLRSYRSQPIFETNCIRSMTPKNQQVRLRLGGNEWLAIIILAVALCGTRAQPAMARGRPVEIADAAIE